MHVSFLIHKLFEIGAVKFGQFTLKSGKSSPIYIDLRLLISTPNLLREAARFIQEKVKGKQIDLVCGVPYGAIPLAAAFSIDSQIPMLLCRKEKKEYGTKQRIEGIFEKDQKCLLIEDVVTSGQSLFETIVPLCAEGLLVEDLAVVVDREEGGKSFLEKKGFAVHALCTLTDIVDELLKEGKINPSTAESVRRFIERRHG